MREDIRNLILAFLFLVLVIVFLVTMVILMSEHAQNKYDNSCKDLGYEEYVYLGGEQFCIDNEGYYYKVRTNGNYKLFELKFREEVLG